MDKFNFSMFRYFLIVEYIAQIQAAASGKMDLHI